MHQFLVLLLLLSAPLALAQDADEPDADTTETAETTEEATEDALDDVDDLGELYPVEDEDVFIPSEDVAFGQSIPFPTDI